MEQIRNFEKHITENGTIVLKFFLHISKEEQRERLLRRLEEKNTIGSSQWRFERKRTRMITCNYEEAINTSTDYAPWYVILPTIKKCAVILWVKSFGKKCRNTLIFKRLKWMRKN
jgi:polyphosphate kinase 2 (PPK2 family)